MSNKRATRSIDSAGSISRPFSDHPFIESVQIAHQFDVFFPRQEFENGGFLGADPDPSLDLVQILPNIQVAVVSGPG